jgi:hypothetical protein
MPNEMPGLGLNIQMAKKKNKNKSKTFRTETYLVGGRMKKRRIPLIDGLEVDEFVRRNADDIFLLQAGYYEILHERETAEARRIEGSLECGPQAGGTARRSAPVPDDCDDELPF